MDWETYREDWIAEFINGPDELEELERRIEDMKQHFGKIYSIDEVVELSYAELLSRAGDR